MDQVAIRDPGPKGLCCSMTPSIIRPQRGSVALDALRNPGPKGLRYTMTPSKFRGPVGAIPKHDAIQIPWPRRGDPET